MTLEVTGRDIDAAYCRAKHGGEHLGRPEGCGSYTAQAIYDELVGNRMCAVHTFVRLADCEIHGPTAMAKAFAAARQLDGPDLDDGPTLYDGESGRRYSAMEIRAWIEKKARSLLERGWRPRVKSDGPYQVEAPTGARPTPPPLAVTFGPENAEAHIRATTGPFYVPRLLEDIKDRDAQTEPTPDRALPLGKPGSKYDHARRPVSTYHLDSPDVAMGDRHYLLEIIAGRDPDAELPRAPIEPEPREARSKPSNLRPCGCPEEGHYEEGCYCAGWEDADD
jgi:hypothetical protein